MALAFMLLKGIASVKRVVTSIMVNRIIIINLTTCKELFHHRHLEQNQVLGGRPSALTKEKEREKQSTDGEGEEEKGAQCMMGSSQTVKACSSTTRGWSKRA